MKRFSIARFHCVFLQVIRYNRLLVVVHQTLKDLLKALKGLVVMSEALETMFNSIYNNSVPELWAAKVQLHVKKLMHGGARQASNLL